MNKTLITIPAGCLLLSLSLAFADEHEGDMQEGEMQEANVARPVEAFACRFNEGMGPDDLDPVIKKFNAWADKQKVTDYWAWTLTPYYFGPDQEFDILWFGASPKAKTLGRIQDNWLATGGKVQEGFNEVITCDTHGNWAALELKESPKRADPSRGVVSFSDCTMANGTTMEDLYPALAEWSEYITEQGSTAGMWMFFAAYGGGGEKFDFKWVQSWQNLEELGADWDRYSESGWRKADELFEGKLDCDASRAYISTTRRMAEVDDT